MNKSEQNLHDVEFIGERVLWFLRLSPQELMAHIRDNRFDAFHTIPDPKRNMLFIGREGSERFEAIARRHLANQPEQRRKTDVIEFVKKLEAEFSRRFVHGGETINRQNVDRMIATAFKLTSMVFTASHHYIPCAFFLTNTFKRFQVGPVEFVSAKEFFAVHRAEIEHLRQVIKDNHQEQCRADVAKGYPAANVATPEDSAKLANHLVDGLLEFFGQHEWFAEVSIPPCAPAVSHERALFLMRAALNIVKLMLGRGHTYRLRTAEDRGNVGKSAKLHRDNDGKLDISLSSAPMNQVLGDECLQALTGPMAVDFAYATRALSLAAGFTDAPPLCLRFLDALAWYGDAVNEPSPAARIVKLITAVEAMCGTEPEHDANGKEVRGVTEIVTTRAAIWHQFWTGKDLRASRKLLARLYKYRSDLVHGSVSPFDDDIMAVSHEAEAATRIVLLVGLDYFTSIGIEHSTWTPRALRQKLQELERPLRSARDQ